ncbi:undecaprenyl-diphosphate phosphatase [Methylocaldum sp.]|uniref:undecaprenyl-diphosphate phosphatase n=1 Tax=Methylocaldum sp. TaxID=1969727 RepID=UPI002D516B24|nr:undecaprenyl-diphosphate phosphatase [Methylocaldum sp.]HYE37458.1 undecaprenyl-diphosphate phosphatase [Methylocaldum sp.]
MDCHHVYYLALLQGLTEFLPISSAAHLILMPVIFGWHDQGLAFDVAVHIGTLTAVVVYYAGALRDMAEAWFRSIAGKGMSTDARLAWYVILGTIPVGIAGLVANDYVETVLRNPVVIATSTIVFALVLWLAQKVSTERRTDADLNWKDALVVGVCQAVALIPGTSRSGITITGGLFLGLDRKAAARFSFLLSIPVTALAGLLKTYELIQSGQAVSWWNMFLGALLSGIVAYVTIDWFLKLLDRTGMLPFVVYRLILGGVLFYVFLPH